MAETGPARDQPDVYSPLRRLQQERERERRGIIPLWTLLPMGLALLAAAGIGGFSLGLLQARAASPPVACRDALQRRLQAEAALVALPHLTRTTTAPAEQLVSITLDQVRLDAAGLRVSANDQAGRYCR